MEYQQQQLRSLGSSYFWDGAAAEVLQAQQLLQLRTAGEHLCKLFLLLILVV
jgi:hypothetical protein